MSGDLNAKGISGIPPQKLTAAQGSAPHSFMTLSESSGLRPPDAPRRGAARKPAMEPFGHPGGQAFCRLPSTRTHADARLRTGRLPCHIAYLERR